MSNVENKPIGNCKVGVVATGRFMKCNKREFEYIGPDPGPIIVGVHGVNRGCFCNMVRLCKNSKGLRPLPDSVDETRLRQAVERLGRSIL